MSAQQLTRGVTHDGMRDCPSPSSPWSLLDPVRRHILVVIVLSVLSAVASVTVLLSVVDIARLFQDAPDSRIWGSVAVIVVAATVRMVSDGTAGLVAHRADNDLQLHLRRRLVAHLRKLPLGWIDSRRSSGVVGAVEKDVSSIHQLIGHTLNESVVAALVPSLSLVALVVIDWRAAIIAVVPVFITFALMGLMMARGAGLQKAYGEAGGELTGAVIEYVRGIAVMKSFHREGEGTGRYSAAVTRFVTAWSAWSRQSNIYLGLIDIVTSPVTVLAAMCSAGVAVAEAGTPVGLIAGLVMGLGLSAAVVQVAMNSEAIMTGTAALASVNEVLATAPVPEPEEPQPITGTDLEMRDVTFSYLDGPVVLDRVSAVFPSRTMTALVGTSGSGKSTLARLLARFYDPDEGQVLLGGTDLRDIATPDLYRTVSVVFQDPQLMGISLRENIRLARADATDDDIMTAARQANIADFITGLPKGLDTVVGLDVELSGGEAQRVAIARAFVTDSPVLILDEITAYADTDSEALIEEAVTALARDRTVVIIAHRLSSVRHADRILVMDEGHIVEQGSHGELVAGDTRYRRLWQAFGGAESAAEEDDK